jgi:hypothetical protein
LPDGSILVPVTVIGSEHPILGAIIVAPRSNC